MSTPRTLASFLLLAALSGPASAAVQPCAKIALSPGDLAVGTTGLAYAQGVSATGGNAYTFSISQGVLPTGLALANAAATTVDIAGTASTPGTFVFTLTARNTADGCTGGRTYAFKVNSRTVVTTTAGTTPFVEDAGPVVVDAGVTVADADNANLASATVTITNPLDGASEVLAATCPGLTVTPGLNSLGIAGSQPVATYEACLRAVTYDNSSQNPDTTARQVSFVASDGTAASPAVTKALSVTPTNDAPTVTASGGSSSFTEDGGAVVVDSGLTVTDPDTTNLASALVTITNPADGAAEVLAASACAGLTVTPGLNSLTIAGSQPVATYQSCLRSVTYENSSQNPGTTARTVAFVANDGTAASAAANKTVTVAAVNDVPVVTTTVGTTAFTEDGGAVVVDAGVTVADLDNANLASATVTITNPSDGAAEVLSATACAGLTVTPSLNALSISGVQPLATYETCLRSVRYDNSSQNPGTTARTIAFVANDGAASSLAANRSVSVAAVNDPPVVTTTAGTTVFVVAGGAVVVDGALTVTDPDTSNLASATITITNPQDGASETLAATSCAGLTVTPGLNSLSIAGSQPVATYQTCLRSVTYNDTAGSPNTSARTVRFVANDGTASSANADRLVDAAPRVTTTSPTNGAINVAASSNIVVNFSESVTATTSSFTLQCPSGSANLPYALSGSGTTSLTLNPNADLARGQLCEVTVVASQVADADLADPPNTMGANLVFSFGVPPDAVDDTYPDTIVGNVRVNSGSRVPTYAATGNDVSGLAFTITAFDATTAQGGSLSMVTSGGTMGQFVYNPPAGFEGNDTFTYTIGNAAGSETATVTLPVSGMLWFVQNGATACTTRANGCGRITNPYSSLSSLQAENNGTGNNPATGDRIFLYESATSYTGPVTLLSGQRLIGQDSPSTLSALAGLTPPSGSDALPAMNSGNGTKTTITNGAGNGVNVGSDNNQVHGLTISGTSGRALGNTANVGTFAMSDVVVDNMATAGAGIAFTGGGTVTATGTNTIATTTASAINVSNTSIGAGGLTFQSISSNGGSATGIILVNTGSAGGLTVTGVGSATTRGGDGSGGTIANKTGTDGDGTTGSGAYVNNGIATLRRMDLHSLQNYGVYGLSVNGLTLQYVTVGSITGSACADADGDIGTSSGSGDAAIVLGKSNPSGLNGFNNGAVATLDGLLVRCSIEHQIEIYQQSNSFTATITNSDVKDNSTAFGSDGILIETQGTANATITVDGMAFDDNKSQPLQGAANDSSVLDLTVNNCTVTRSSQGNEGFVLSNGSNGRLITHVTNNNISGIGGVSIFVGQTAGNANALAGGAVGLTAVIKGNTITTPASATNHALIAYLTSTVGQVSLANILIESNVIAQNSTSGVARPFLIDTPDNLTTPSWTATVLNNNVTFVDPGTGTTADVTARRGAGCFDVRNNTIAGPFGIRVRQASPATVQLEQGVSGSTVAAMVLDDNHPAGTLTTVLGTVTVVGNSTCMIAPN